MNPDVAAEVHQKVARGTGEEVAVAEIHGVAFGDAAEIQFHAGLIESGGMGGEDEVAVADVAGDGGNIVVGGDMGRDGIGIESPKADEGLNGGLKGAIADF